MKQDWRRTKEYRKWRIEVLRRDKRCVICNSIKHREAHHMNHSTYFKEERFDINNGITLCKHCHSVFHTSFKRSYRTKCTKYDFSQFIELITRMSDILNKEK
jgi:5-methylcytosine-specific restriction endonuclease McrA